MAKPLLRLQNMTKSFSLPQGRVPVLEDLNFTVDNGEFVAIVGPTGVGKSTLLRLINGIILPDKGEIQFRGKPLKGVNLETSLVFQNFALLPWLTVYQNVALGLETRIVDPRLRRRKTAFYIDKVGLDGYENAYPRELSGGMKQRVGLARALAVEPSLLLMDEPFSSVDVLTSIHLRDQLIDIFLDPDIPVSTVMMVTHMLEEAILLADRVLVLSQRPGKLIEDIRVTLTRPRNKRDPAFLEYVDKVFSLIA